MIKSTLKMIIRKALKEDAKNHFHLYLMLASGEVMCKFIGEQKSYQSWEFLYTSWKRETEPITLILTAYVAVKRMLIIVRFDLWWGEIDELRNQSWSPIHAISTWTIREMRPKLENIQWTLLAVITSAFKAKGVVGFQQCFSCHSGTKLTFQRQWGPTCGQAETQRAKKCIFRLRIKPLEKTLLGLSLAHLQLKELK